MKRIIALAFLVLLSSLVQSFVSARISSITAEGLAEPSNRFGVQRGGKA